MLLQVAVVLVRRVLGRADQRKRCQGQMETLERLRGVREHVQDDEDAFIAEVRMKDMAGVNESDHRDWLTSCQLVQDISFNFKNEITNFSAFAKAITFQKDGKGS